MTIFRDSDREPAGDVRIEGPALIRERLAVGGMTCGSCVSRVEQALLGVRGVATAKVDLAAGTAMVSYDSTLVAFPSLREAVEATG